MDRDTVTLRIKKNYVYLAVGLTVGLGAGFFLGRTGSSSAPPTRAAAEQALPPDFASAPVVAVAIDGRPAQGPEDAPVTLVEFTDYQCSFCRRHFQQTYPGLIAEYGSRLRYVVRNFPLGSIHANATKAAEAAECASDQASFWEYHDLLFQKQAVGLDTESLKRYAAELGLHPERFAECLDSGAKAEVVATDVEDGVSYGVGGTPAFFINGRMLRGAQPLTVFRSFIESALQETSGR